VDVIGGHYCNSFDPVFQSRFAYRHCFEVIVNARRIKSKYGARGLRLFGRRRQRTCDQLKSPVNTGCDPVYTADKSVISTANHAKPNGSFICHCLYPYHLAACTEALEFITVPLGKRISGQIKKTAIPRVKGRFIAC
jgi:hypothetical protein